VNRAANALEGGARQQPKPQFKALSPPPAAMFGQIGSPSQAVRPNKTARRLQTFAANPQQGLDSWQAALSAALRPPLWGETEGEQQANQTLMATRESGMLDDLRARLEARRAQSPRDLVAGRMLAAVYDFGFSFESALRERRRIVGLEGATGEDWYALADAEERAGNGAAARTDYRRALDAPGPLSSFHAAIARQRS
jgi:hypothetical protein